MSDWELAANAVHCWLFAPSQFQASELFDVLAWDERARASQFAFERDRMQYAVCRGVLRHMLGRYGAGDPAGLRFKYAAHGKPSLAAESNADGIEFNLAHSHDLAAIAVTRGRQVGIDIEQIRPFADLQAMAETSFAPEEQAELAALDPAQQLRAFFAGWTRKEAFMKATGEGFSRATGSFAFSIDPDKPPRLLRVDGHPRPISDWTAMDLEIGLTARAAVVVDGADAVIQARTLSPEWLGLSKESGRIRAP
jgi:4'-phosphopantetheinyl transferase